MSSRKHFDHVVIGTGSMGAAACYFLAKRGRRVLGIDRFQAPHRSGSHGGETRIIRKAYFEHPNYIPLLERAYTNWRELEGISGRRCYFETGLLYAGQKGNAILKGVKTAASEYNVPLELLRNQPLGVFQLPSDYDLMFEPEAGFLLPDVAINAYLRCATQLGAELHSNEQVLDIEYGSEAVVVRTSRSEYTCDKVVITAGAWSDELIPGIRRHLNVTRQVVAWFETDGSEKYGLGHFPCWLIADEDKPGVYYGFPETGSMDGLTPGLKIAYHHPGVSTHPDRVDRTIQESDLEHLTAFMRQYLPEVKNRLVDACVCLYCNSPDEQFVIDNLPGNEDQACVAWGFSGHGFKFASAVGEILADLAMHGKTDFPIGFLHAGRFH